MRTAAQRMRDFWEKRASHNAMYFIDASQKSWDIDSFYAKGNAIVERVIDPILNNLAIDPGEKAVLEIGCGMGRLFPALSRRFAEVYGVDVSEEMLARGMSLCPQAAHWILCDGLSMSGVHDASVDYVISFEVFQHIPDPEVIEGYFSEIFRVLNGRGAFQIQMRCGSDTKRQELIRRLPRFGRVAVSRTLRQIGALDVVGDIDTWLGCVVQPRDAVLMAVRAGFEGVSVVSDDFHPQGMGYWIIGRRPPINELGRSTSAM